MWKVPGHALLLGNQSGPKVCSSPAAAPGHLTLPIRPPLVRLTKVSISSVLAPAMGCRGINKKATNKNTKIGRIREGEQRGG